MPEPEVPEPEGAGLQVPGSEGAVPDVSGSEGAVLQVPGSEVPGSEVPGSEAGGGGSRAGRPERMAVGFARLLRARGLAVPTDAVATFTEALGAVGIDDRPHVYWAGRATLVHRPEDVAVYDRCFAAWWLAQPLATTVVAVEPAVVAHDADEPDDPGDDDAEGEERLLQVVRYSAAELLRQRDFADYDERDWAEADALMAALRVAVAPRRSRRLRPTHHRRGRPDLRRTLRLALENGGEPLRRAWRAPSQTPRRLVVLIDVSGSMDSYARGLLRFAHAAMVARPGRTEVFAMGTRLTRLSRELSHHDPDTALASAAEAVADWSGGTRLGEGLAAFNDHYGARGMARGAVVVVLSDGWDRGRPDQLAAEMTRLRRLAHRVVWANPLKASPGFAPLARGMAAALPHVDAFVEGHLLAALQELAEVIAEGPDRRRPVPVS